MLLHVLLFILSVAGLFELGLISLKYAFSSSSINTFKAPLGFLPVVFVELNSISLESLCLLLCGNNNNILLLSVGALLTVLVVVLNSLGAGVNVINLFDSCLLDIVDPVRFPNVLSDDV